MRNLDLEWVVGMIRDHVGGEGGVELVDDGRHLEWSRVIDRMQGSAKKKVNCSRR